MAAAACVFCRRMRPDRTHWGLQAAPHLWIRRGRWGTWVNDNLYVGHTGPTRRPPVPTEPISGLLFAGGTVGRHASAAAPRQLEVCLQSWAPLGQLAGDQAACLKDELGTALRAIDAAVRVLSSVSTNEHCSFSGGHHDTGRCHARERDRCITQRCQHGQATAWPAWPTACQQRPQTQRQARKGRG